MYNTSYEEYMRTVLGYTPNYMKDTFANNDYYIMQTNNNRMCESDLDDLFPDIYIKIYPLVCDECNSNSMPITQEILEQMTDNVLKKIEIDLKVQTNVKIENRKEEVKSTNSRMQENNTKREDRAQQNNLLRDLIRILILRELINGGKFPSRPFNPRPPMPGPRPPFPGGRPGGIMPRDFWKIYQLNMKNN